MDATTRKSQPPDQWPENRQYVYLVREMAHADKEGSVKERIKASKDLLDFINLGTLEGQTKGIAEMLMRRVCNEKIKKYSAELRAPSSASALQGNTPHPPCPPFGGQ
jgi:hypothetical protein